MEGSSESSWVWEGPKRQVSLNPGALGTTCIFEGMPGHHQSRRRDIPRDIGRLALVTSRISCWPTFLPCSSEPGQMTQHL